MKTIPSVGRFFRWAAPRLFGLGLAGSIVLSAGYSEAVAADLRHVTIGLPKAADPGDIIYGITRGYFAEEGLEVQLVALDGSGIVIPQVAAGKIDFGYVNPSLLVIALGRGQPFPVRLIYNHQRNNIFRIVTLEDSPIRSVGQIAGHPFGLPTLNGGENPLIKAILENSGVAWDDLEVLPTGHGPAGWRRLAVGDVAALALPNQAAEQAAVSGIPIRRLPLPDPFPTLFSTGYIAHETVVEKDPSLVEAFGRAVAKSTTACAANVVACAQAFWAYDPASKPASAEEQAHWTENAVRVVTAYNEAIVPLQQGEPDLWGRYPEAAWATWLDVLKGAGQIETTDLPLDRVYTNRFVDAYNDFDRVAIVRSVAGGS